jgi:hypothetical protein
VARGLVEILGATRQVERERRTATVAGKKLAGKKATRGRGARVATGPDAAGNSGP